MTLPSINRRNKIVNDLSDLKLRTGLSYPENNLLDIIKGFGIEVKEADLSEFPKVNGVIQYPDGETSIPTISISKNLSPEGKTFTLAHELGHFILHKGNDSLFIDEFEYAKIGNQISQDEVDANYFAVNLLVPTEKIKRILKITHEIEPLSKYFGVSKDVIETKLGWMSQPK